MKSPRFNTLFAKSLMAGAAACAITAGTAVAQSDEIIVTATKRPQTLQEVPVAVSVVDAEVIEKANIKDLLDLQTSVPSLRLTQLQNSSQTNFTIRGFGNGANNPGIEPSVGVFIDGVYRSRSAAAILDLPTLERVEVLRGPQSTLFGKNVSAGAISLTTKAPEFDLGGSVEASYGNFDQMIFRGTITGPISETLAFRLSGSTNNRDGYYTNIVDGTSQNERDRYAVRGQLLWEPSDVLSFRAIGDYNKIDEICCGAVQVVNGPATQLIGAPVAFGGLGEEIGPASTPFARQVALDTTTRNKLEGYGASLQGDWDLEWAQVTSISSYREQTDNTQTDVDFSGADLARNPQNRKYETFTQELRIASTGDGPFSWLVGGFYFDESVEFERDVVFGTQMNAFANALAGGGTSLLAIEGGTQVAAALTTGPTAVFPSLGPIQPTPFGASFTPGTGVFGDYTMDNQSYSIFGQFDFEITDRLTLTGGIAYLHDKKEAVGVSTLTDFTSLFDEVNGGQALVAAGAFGTVVDGTALALGGAPINPVTMMPFSSADFVFDPTNPAGFIGSALTLAAVDPAFFAAVQGGSVGFAQANPTLNPLLGVGALQFFAPQVNFPDASNPFDTGRRTDDEIVYTARLAYDVTDNMNAYFTYSTGWKAGAINLSSDSRPPVDATGLGRFAAPEDVELFEFGVKTGFDGGWVNIALFQQTIDGFQSNVFNGAGFDLANAEEQRVRGFEIESLYSPWEALDLTFGLTYLDPEYVSFTAAGCTPFDVVNCGNGEAFRDLSGTRVPGVHEISMSTSATYSRDFTDTMGGFFRVEYLHESRVPLIENIPASITRDVKLVNASIGLDWENGFEVIAWGRNLTNNEYFLQGFPTVVQPGSVSAYTNEPRTYGVTVRKKF